MVNAFPCVFQNDAFYLLIGLTFNDAISDFRSGVLQQLKLTSKKIKKKNVRAINISPCADCVKEAIVRVFSYHVVTFCFVGTVDNIS